MSIISIEEFDAYFDELDCPEMKECYDFSDEALDYAFTLEDI